MSIGDATRIERKKHTFEFSFFSAAGEARIIATSIPLAILTSLIALSLIGQTINIMTLGGFALAVGILVDDATVEVENINRNRAAEPDKDMDEVVLDSAMQIATPAFVSTLSICKFCCRTVAASGVLMNNNQYENHRRFDLRVREGLNHG